MREKKPDEPKKGAPAYMNTYGDMMTLLLCFFVLLFSMADVDSQKFSAAIGSFEGGNGLLVGGNSLVEKPTSGSKADGDIDEETIEQQKINEELKKVEQSLGEFIQDSDLQSLVTVEKEDSDVVIRFDDVLLFDTGKALIKEGGIPVLSAVGNELTKYVRDGYYLRFEGHTDNRPIKTLQFPSNWELSSSRAIAGAKFFIEEMGYDPAVISAEGFGEYRPIADNSTDKGRAINRRMEIKVTKPKK